jgi:hypothetical protein
MRRRWLVGTLVVLSTLALAGRVVTLAQRPETLKVMRDSVPTGSKEAPPKGWRSAGDPQVKTANGPLPPAEPAAEDPMGAVESFLQRNQKEADDSIKALTQEAEALRARLQKVESALGRWKGVAQALELQSRSGVNSPPPVPQNKLGEPGPEAGPELLPASETLVPPPPASSPPEPPPLTNPGTTPPPVPPPILPDSPPKAASEGSASGPLSKSAAFRPKRVAELLVSSENLRQGGDEWERFWFLDQPSHMTPFRTHGGLGP